MSELLGRLKKRGTLNSPLEIECLKEIERLTADGTDLRKAFELLCEFYDDMVYMEGMRSIEIDAAITAVSVKTTEQHDDGEKEAAALSEIDR